MYELRRFEYDQFANYLHVMMHIHMATLICKLIRFKCENEKDYSLDYLCGGAPHQLFINIGAPGIHYDNTVIVDINDPILVLLSPGNIFHEHMITSTYSILDDVSIIATRYGVHLDLHPFLYLSARGVRYTFEDGVMHPKPLSDIDWNAIRCANICVGELGEKYRRMHSALWAAMELSDILIEFDNDYLPDWLMNNVDFINHYNTIASQEWRLERCMMDPIIQSITIRKTLRGEFTNFITSMEVVFNQDTCISNSYDELGINRYREWDKSSTSHYDHQRNLSLIVAQLINPNDLYLQTLRDIRNQLNKNEYK
jgi:hypothetical protein